MWPPITAPSIRSCPSCGPRWPDLAPQPPDHPDGHHRRQCRADSRAVDADYWVANLRNPVRFSQADRRCRRHSTPRSSRSAHTRCSPMRSPTPWPTPTTTPWEPCPRHPRHLDLPHQPQRHPHHPPTGHRPPTRTPPPPTHHPLAPHPPLDHPHLDHTAGKTSAAGHRRDRSNQRHPRLGKHAEPGFSVAGRPPRRQCLRPARRRLRRTRAGGRHRCIRP